MANRGVRHTLHAHAIGRVTGDGVSLVRQVLGLAARVLGIHGLMSLNGLSIPQRALIGGRRRLHGLIVGRLIAAQVGVGIADRHALRVGRVGGQLAVVLLRRGHVQTELIVGHGEFVIHRLPQGVASDRPDTQELGLLQAERMLLGGHVDRFLATPRRRILIAGHGRRGQRLVKLERFAGHVGRMVQQGRPRGGQVLGVEGREQGLIDGPGGADERGPRCHRVRLGLHKTPLVVLFGQSESGGARLRGGGHRVLIRVLRGRLTASACLFGQRGGRRQFQHVRQLFLFDPLVVRRQAIIKDALRHLDRFVTRLERERVGFGARTGQRGVRVIVVFVGVGLLGRLQHLGGRDRLLELLHVGGVAGIIGAVVGQFGRCRLAPRLVIGLCLCECRHQCRVETGDGFLIGPLVLLQGVPILVLGVLFGLGQDTRLVRQVDGRYRARWSLLNAASFRNDCRVIGRVVGGGSGVERGLGHSLARRICILGRADGLLILGLGVRHLRLVHEILIECVG